MRRQSIVYGLKWLISIVFFVILYYRVNDLRALPADILSIGSVYPQWLSLTLLLLMLNWGLEALKWRKLLMETHNVNLFEALKYVLTGVTLGFVTPGRSGEFAGRMILLPEGKRLQTIVLSMLGGIAQIMPIIFSGILISLLGTFHLIGKEIDAIMLSVCFGLATVVYFFIQSLIQWRWLHDALLKMDISEAILPTISTRFVVLFLSVLRFGVFVLQYAMLLKAAGISFEFSFIPIAWMLLLQSFSPAVALLDIGVRGSIAFWVFSAFGLMSDKVLAAVLLVWFINLCLPAVVGYFFILQWKKRNRN